MKNYTLLTILILLSVITTAQQATFNWVPVTFSGGNLQGMSVTGDTSAVIVGYDNTFKKSTDKGFSWFDLNAFKAEYDFIGMSAANDVAFLSSRKANVVDHPSGGKPDVYVSGALLKTTDKGSSWEVMDISKIGTGDDVSLNPNAAGGYEKDIYSVGVYNEDTVFVYLGWKDITSGTNVLRGAVFRTNNGGSSWEAITPDLGSSKITSIVIQDSIALFGGNKTFYRANILTNTVTDLSLAVGTTTGSSSFFINAITSKNAGIFYLTTTSHGIVKTEDGGQSFTKLSGISGSNDLYVLNDTSIVVLGGTAKSVISTDNGNTWTDCHPEETIYKVGGVLGDTLYALAKSNAYKIAVSDLLEKDFNWSAIALSDGENLQKMVIFDDTNAVISGYAQTCKRTTDGGLTWQQTALPGDFNEDVDFDFNGISASGENAFTTVRRFKIADLPSESTVNDYYMEGLVLSTNNNWETINILDVSKIGVNDGPDATKNPQAEGCFALNPYVTECVDNNTAYVYANWYETVTNGTPEDRGRVFKTTDAGGSWSAVTEDFENSYINGIEFIGEVGYIAGNGILLKTTDGGANFTNLFPAMVLANNNDSNIFPKTISLVDENEIYIPTTSDGVFISDDGGLSFSKFENVEGGNDICKLDQNSFMILGTTSKSYFTNDGGSTWQNPNVGKPIYSIGGVLNDSLYALGSGSIYKISLADLDLTTSIPVILVNNELSIRYKSNSIELVSSEKNIDICRVYSLSGQLIAITKPFSQRVELQNNTFTPGVYIVSAMAGGKVYNNKVVFK